MDTSAVEGLAFIEEVGGYEIHLFGYKSGFRYHSMAVTDENTTAAEIEDLIKRMTAWSKEVGLNVTVMPSIRLTIECAELREYARAHPVEAAIAHAERIAQGYITTESGLQFRIIDETA